MFANVFFEIATTAEMQDYIELVNRHITRKDRKLMLACAFENVEGPVKEHAGDDVVLHIVPLEDGEYCGEMGYDVWLPTFERQTLEIIYAEMPDDVNSPYPELHCDAAPAHFALFIDGLNDGLFA